MYEPWPDRKYPAVWRVLLAFLLAPGAAALLMAISMPGYAGIPSWSERVWRSAELYAALGAYPITLVFGVPAYFMLRRHLSARPLPCALVGAVVAVFPWMLIILIGPGASEASIDGRATVLNGHTTAYGWLQNAEFVLMMAFFGAVGGLIFWAVAAAGDRPDHLETEEQTEA